MGLYRLEVYRLECYLGPWKTLLAATVGHVQELGGALLGGLAAAVVAGGSLDLGMPGELLDCAEVCARVQQIADECPTQVVWRERCHARLDGATPRDVQH